MVGGSGGERGQTDVLLNHHWKNCAKPHLGKQERVKNWSQGLMPAQSNL